MRIPHANGAVLMLGGWTRATRHYLLDESGRARDLELSPVGPFDAPAGIVAREARVKSHDGVEVPVSILTGRDTKLDGRNPLMLYGYGAYGNVEEPALSPRLLAWLERGGVYAIAHVRGGGVFGDAWRRAGWKTTKPNTWKDGIAVAEWLIANGYTSKDRLSVYGGSAGGIFVGRAITERPDLFRSAVIAVGNVDSIRSETRANGVANIPEYGTVKKEDEFRALLAMSPYANVKAGTSYPAVLFEHGVNDSPRRRVDVAEARLAHRVGDDERRAGAAEARLRRRPRRRCDARAVAAPDRRPLELHALAGGRARVSSRRRAERMQRRWAPASRGAATKTFVVVPAQAETQCRSSLQPDLPVERDVETELLVGHAHLHRERLVALAARRQRSPSRPPARSRAAN